MASRPRLRSDFESCIALDHHIERKRVTETRSEPRHGSGARLASADTSFAKVGINSSSRHQRPCTQERKAEWHIETTSHFNMDKTRFQLLDSFQIEAILNCLQIASYARRSRSYVRMLCCDDVSSGVVIPNADTVWVSATGVPGRAFCDEMSLKRATATIRRLHATKGSTRF